MQHTALPKRSVWRRPRNEPLEDIDRTILIAIFHQSTVRAAIRAFPQRHGLFPSTPATGLAGLTFADSMQCFPSAQTLIDEHLHKAIKTPVVIHHAVTDLPLALLFGGLLLLFLHDHLPLGKIANDHSPFSQLVSDEVGSFMQTVLLFASFAFRDPLIHLREAEIASRFLFALVALRTNFIELTVVPPTAFEPMNMIDSPLVGVARCQRFDAQVKGHDAGSLVVRLRCLIEKGAVVVS